MRLRVTTIIGIVLLAGFPLACTLDSEDQGTNCEDITVAPTSLAAAGTATCAPLITFDGHDYLFACVWFRPGQLGVSDLVGTDSTGEQVRARSIKGVVPEDALAVSGFGSGKCGHWQLAYDLSMSKVEFSRIARTGTTSPH